MANLHQDIKYILLMWASIITFLLTLATYLYLPVYLSRAIWTQLIISKDSASFEGWRLNPIPIIDRFYLYNITNYDEIIKSLSTAPLYLDKSQIDGQDTGRNGGQFRNIPLAIKELGPFTYRQERQKVNISFQGAEGGSVVYDQLKRWHFMPDLTMNPANSYNVTDNNQTAGVAVDEGGLMNNVMQMPIYHINLPLAGTTINSEYAELVDNFISDNNLKLMQRHTVGELLFDGYQDQLMLLAKESGQLEIDRFGWLFAQNDTSSGRFKIFTGAPRALERFGSVQQVNSLDKLSVWPKNEPRDSCNQFQGASTGELFPPELDSFLATNLRVATSSWLPQWVSATAKKSKASPRQTIHLFMADICRTFELNFNGTHDLNGLQVNRYRANEDTFRYSDTDNSSRNSATLMRDSAVDRNRCLCLKDIPSTADQHRCPPNGMMDLFTCRKGSPLTVSFPHFLYSHQDKTLEPFLRHIKDLRAPNEQEHGFFLDLEASLNLPVRAQVSLQFNAHYRPEVAKLNFTRSYTSLFKPWSALDVGDYYIPQMWFTSQVQLDDKTLEKMLFLQSYLELVAPVATAILFVALLILIFMALLIRPKYNKLDTTIGTSERDEDYDQDHDHDHQKCCEKLNYQALSSSITSLTRQHNDNNNKQKYQQLQMESLLATMANSNGSTLTR